MSENPNAELTRQVSIHSAGAPVASASMECSPLQFPQPGLELGTGLADNQDTFVSARSSYQPEATGGELDFERLVGLYYDPLYRFAMSLTHSESDAGDLVQDTFLTWAAKGHQLLDHSKVKSWLFTTLHRRFLESQRRSTRFPQVELTVAEADLPNLEPELVNHLDAQHVVELLAQVDAQFRAAVALFYLEDYSYNEIAGILEIPMGTVKSRIARGLGQLKELLLRRARPGSEPKEGIL